ncbi:MAG: hypothetical protein IID36_07155 [Planctomycetes bacterium]|nr:hypothetical protein [Planctomycetota bacterium]
MVDSAGVHRGERIVAFAAHANGIHEKGGHMGLISIAAFKPKPGMEEELLRVIADRLPLLRRLGFATDREAMLMKSKDGVVIQISEWVDNEAIRRAHETPEVLTLWERFDACSDYVKLEAIAECREDFATFDALDG